MTARATLSDQLKEARQAAGLTLQEVADRLGHGHRQQVHRIERNADQIVASVTAQADALGLEIRLVKQQE